MRSIYDVENERNRYAAEELECLIEFLNKLGVPKENEYSDQYSIIGRVMALVESDYWKRKLREDNINKLL